MLDEVVADSPVYLDANDYHSCWLNTAALKEAGITRDTPDPIGGRLARDAAGEPTGMVYETAAQQYVWPALAEQATDDERDAAIERALDAYLAAGVTGAVDMAMDGVALAALQRVAARRAGRLPIRVAAHWLVANTGDEQRNLAQVAEARPAGRLGRRPVAARGGDQARAGRRDRRLYRGDARPVRQRGRTPVRSGRPRTSTRSWRPRTPPGCRSRCTRSAIWPARSRSTPSSTRSR